MKYEHIIIVNKIAGYLFSAGFGTVAINDLYKGISAGNKNYLQMAAAEGIVAAGIGAMTFLRGRERETINRFANFSYETAIPQIAESTVALDREFQELFDDQ
ncbi:MAG: hypothetical protein QMD85_03425, partial [Candidatus Aenigmarchaeota archaeon]|nr:hypothetical protein [Candidatus Aenigmarchaeota archaeon]MDI6722594.1 hypothetical protein [Candidatus Aenigmarchaeota archaeon]